MRISFPFSFTLTTSHGHIFTSWSTCCWTCWLTIRRSTSGGSWPSNCRPNRSLGRYLMDTFPRWHMASISRSSNTSLGWRNGTTLDQLVLWLPGRSWRGQHHGQRPTKPIFVWTYTTPYYVILALQSSSTSVDQFLAPAQWTSPSIAVVLASSRATTRSDPLHVWSRTPYQSTHLLCHQLLQPYGSLASHWWWRLVIPDARDCTLAHLHEHVGPSSIPSDPTLWTQRGEVHLHPQDDSTQYVETLEQSILAPVVPSFSCSISTHWDFVGHRFPTKGHQNRREPGQRRPLHTYTWMQYFMGPSPLLPTLDWINTATCVSHCFTGWKTKPTPRGHIWARAGYIPGEDANLHNYDFPRYELPR